MFVICINKVHMFVICINKVHMFVICVNMVHMFVICVNKVHMFVICVNKVHMFVICVNTICNVSNFSRKKKMAILRIIHTFVVVVVVLRLVSRWVLNEIPIRERVCNVGKLRNKTVVTIRKRAAECNNCTRKAMIDGGGRTYRNRTYLLVVEPPLETKMAAFNYCKFFCFK